MKPEDNAEAVKSWRSRDEAHWAEERLCDYAAAELTMPQPLFDECVAAGASLKELSDIFQVSELMVAVRQMGIEALPLPSMRYEENRPELFIRIQMVREKPFVVVWAPNTIQAFCRCHPLDIIGIPHILGIREVPTLFQWAGLKKYAIYYIPYLVIGYTVHNDIEDDPRCRVELMCGLP